ncbi:hypothetical protein [Halalkalicoccus jeotgali]|uniref:Uncharacterized protein n=1 Tax=Halalkalicoccus jeotgali (strain DSM 18796 / CECT 7217 / JCM 14584 / KCTC 4019 / B3) TaxID=795797 RepID=D8J6C2_HALJB|nr:hypothetical protein [Halalkalicoccus jeotgali]ADJ15840.1 hypothetical protein HacjB3_12285 [Halalkalicoccus jeotgali B3]ELY37936.1 hypothetical protein C497_07479 [Halalkalicoccus jeotgali B3]
MSERADDGKSTDEGSGGLGGMLLMIGVLDLLLLGLAAYTFSLGEPTAGTGILALALVLTGIDLFLYRRGSF